MSESTLLQIELFHFLALLNPVYKFVLPWLQVKTSLKSEGQCVRKFPSKTQPGTINTINFAFKTSEPNRNMMFLLIQNNEIPEGDKEKVDN